MQIKDRLESNSDKKERLRRIATFPASKSLSESNQKNLLSPFEEEKISLILAEVSKAREIYAIPPIIARIYLSSACYHNCSGCSFAHSQISDKVFLSSDHFRKLIDDLPSMNIKLIDLTGGGEPTLHPQFIDFVKMCLNQKFQLALLSNGTWNDSRLIDLLAEGFSFIRVNLDASSGEVYDRVHHTPFRGEFQRMMNNLEKMISEREKRKSGLIIGAKVRLCQANMNYVEGMITLTRDLGLDYIQFQINPSDLEPLLPEQKKNVNEILNELKYRHHSQLIYGELEEEKTGDRCWASKAQLTIDASGNVYPCPYCLDQTDASPLGNFLNRTMNDLWLDYDNKRRLKPNTMKTCPVENCRWRFYDNIIRQRIKTKL